MHFLFLENAPCGIKPNSYLEMRGGGGDALRVCRCTPGSSIYVYTHICSARVYIHICTHAYLLSILAL